MNTREILVAIAIGLFVGLIGGGLMMLLNNYYDRQYAERYLEFYRTDLKGNITDLEFSGGKTFIRVDEGKEYMMDSYTVSEQQETFYSCRSGKEIH